MSNRTQRKAETHAKIIASAGRAFRRCGYAGAGVDDVMKGAGLTAGGFYAHFESKEDLFAEMLQSALNDSWELVTKDLSHLFGLDWVKGIIDRYLSMAHVDAVTEGCPLPPLIGEVARAGKATRRVFEEHLKKKNELVASKFPLDDPAISRRTATAGFATLVGAVAIARAAATKEYADEVLSLAREFLDEHMRMTMERSARGKSPKSTTKPAAVKRKAKSE